MLGATDSNCEDECGRGCQNRLPRPFIRGFSQPHFKLLNHTGALRMCAYQSTSHSEDKTEKPLSDLAPQLCRAVFLSTFPSQACRGVEAYLWGLYSDIRSFALEISHLGGQYETPPNTNMIAVSKRPQGLGRRLSDYEHMWLIQRTQVWFLLGSTTAFSLAPGDLWDLLLASLV